MPRFPVIASIFLLICSISAAVLVPNLLKQVQPVATDVEIAISQQLSAEVAISGKIRLRFLPRPQLIVERVSVTQGNIENDLLAMRIPHLVVDLSLIDLLQEKIGVVAVSAIEADVNVKLADDPVGFIDRLRGQNRIATAFLNSRFRITGLDKMRPDRAVTIDNLSARINAGGSYTPLVLKASKRLTDGQLARVELQLLTSFNQSQLNLAAQLGRHERLAFDGFITNRNQDWQVNGEIELNSVDLLVRNIEAVLPIAVSPEARNVRIMGLVRGNQYGFLAETMEVEVLDTLFRSRLSLDWPREPDKAPILSGRLTTGALNLDLLSAQDVRADSEMALSDVWQSFAAPLVMDLRVEATRFTLGDELGSNMVLAFEWQENAIDIERLNMELPFSSSLSLVGLVDTSTPQTGFNGNFSARSSDSLAAVLWVGSRFGLDFAPAAERIDEGRLQRVSVVGDAVLNDAGLSLSGLAARLGDDFLDGEIVVSAMAGPAINADLNFDRLDLTDWGIVDMDAVTREAEASPIWPQIDRLLSEGLRHENGNRQIKLNLQVAEAFAGPQPLGSLSLVAAVNDRHVQLSDLRMNELAGAALSASGQLFYDATPTHGRLVLNIDSPTGGWVESWLFSGFGPLAPIERLPVQLAADITLTAPDDPSWPIVNVVGSGSLGKATLEFDASTPSRTLTLSQAGSNVELNLRGAANDLAEAFALPQIYQTGEGGGLELDLKAQTNELSALSASLRMADDIASLSATLRPSADGARLEGALNFSLGDVLPLIDPTAQNEYALAAIGSAQVNATDNNLSFAALDMTLGAGRLSGEGVLALSGRLPRLDARIEAEGLDFSWALPIFAKDGWQENPLQWAYLGYGNADIGFTSTDIMVDALKIDSLSGRVKITDGVLEAPAISLAMMQGEALLNLQAEGGSLLPRFSVDGNFSGVNPSGLFLQQYGNRLIDAPISGALSLSGRGTSSLAVMSSLNGNLQFEIAPGFLTVFDAVGFGEAVLSPDFDGSADKLIAQFEGAEELAFARGVGLAELRQGRVEAASTDIVFASGLNEANLQANFDFVDLQLQSDFALYPLDRQRPVVWQLSGDVRKPDFKSDASAFNVAAAPAPSVTPQPAE